MSERRSVVEHSNGNGDSGGAGCHCHDWTTINAENNRVDLDEADPSRSLDDFLELAAQSTTSHWRFYLLFTSLGIANSSDAAEILCLSYILSDRGFQNQFLGNNSAGWLAAAVFAGMLLGGLVVGVMGDHYGRRPMLQLGLTCNVVAGLLSSISPNLTVLTICRFATGLGIGATIPPLFTLCTELSPPLDRGYYVTFVASFWMVGSIYVALCGWCILGSTEDKNSTSQAWRSLLAACAVPSGVGLFSITSLAPESPRFLAMQGMHRSALKSVNYLARLLGSKLPRYTESEMLRQYPHTRLSAITTVTTRVSTSRTLKERAIVSVSEFCKSAGQLYRPHTIATTVPLQFVWFSLSFGSYGLLTWINTIFELVNMENVYSNALLFALANLPGNILSAVLMDRVGRVSMFVASVTASALSLLVFAYAAGMVDSSSSAVTPVLYVTVTIVVAACCFQCFTVAAWNAINVVTSELFPTAIRSTGLGLCAASGRVGAMVAQGCNGLLINAGQTELLLLLAAVMLFSGAMILPCCLLCSSSSFDRTGQAVFDRVDSDDARNEVNGSSCMTDDTTSTMPITERAPLQTRYERVQSNSTTTSSDHENNEEHTIT